MSTIVGGIRSRMISDSFFQMVKRSLDALGWFDDTTNYLPIQLVRGDVDWADPIGQNTLAVSESDIIPTDVEMGSNYGEHRWTAYVDFYAENDSLGKHVAGDIRDFLSGRMPSIGRNRPVLDVLDWRQAANVDVDTPPKLFVVDIENVIQDRAHNKSRPYEQHWYSIVLELVDTYGDENDA